MRTLKRHSHEKGESLRSVRGSVVISILAKFILIFIYGYYFYSTLFHTTKSMAAVIFAELVLRRAGGFHPALAAKFAVTLLQTRHWDAKGK